MDEFTVVRCQTCAHMASGFDEDAQGTVAALPGVDEVLAEGLRAVVRGSRHGVLVTSGCRLRPGLCGARRPGLMVLVQACDAGRRPVSSVIAIGPVRSTDDVRAVTRWLQTGGAPDPMALPARLRCAIDRESARG